MKTMTKLIAILALSVASCWGQQYTLATTTLGAALTNSATTVTLASTSTMLGRGDANRIDTCFYVDRELFGVISVVNSTTVTVQRRGGGCGALGASSRPVAHANGAKVYFAITQTFGNVLMPASTLIGKNTVEMSEDFGSCTAANEPTLPKIYLFSGDVMDCKRTGAVGTSGQWIRISNGTMATAEGQRISGFCTGTVGSAETEFLNGAACSGATTATARQLVTAPGTLANLYIVSSANSLGTGGTVASVVLNGTATAIVCSIAAAAKTCSDTVHSVAVVPGDVVTFSYLTSTSDTAANIGAAVGLY